MEKLTPSKVARIKAKNGRPTKNDHIYSQLVLLRVGEALKIAVDEWKTKTQPCWNVNPVMRSRRIKCRFSCKTLPDGEGWAIIRVK